MTAFDADSPTVAATDQGGDAACWAHLVCEVCGRVSEPGVTHHCEGDDDEATFHSPS